MSAVWSVEQQRCLTALGYTLYRHAGASVPIEAEAEADAASPSPAAIVPATAVTSAQSPVVDVGTRAPIAIDPLVRALLRAADLDPVQIDDAQGWLRAQQIPSLTQLRNNPAAKRALWPRLRALRIQRAKP